MPTDLPIYPVPEFTLITDAAGVKALADRVAEAKEPFALDTEAHAKPGFELVDKAALNPRTGQIRIISISFEPGEMAYVIDTRATGAECLQPLWDALEDDDGAPIVMHNAVYDTSMLWGNYGCILPPGRIRCTLLQERALTAGEVEPRFKGKREDAEYTLEDLTDMLGRGVGMRHDEVGVNLQATTKRRLGKVLPKEEQGSNWGAANLRNAQHAYAATDPDATLADYRVQLPALKKHGLEATAELENKLVFTMAWMQLNGMPINKQRMPELRKSLLEDEGRLKQALLEQLDASLKELGYPGLNRDIFGEYDQRHCKPTSPVGFLEWMRKAGLKLDGLNKEEIALSPQLQHPLMQAYQRWAAAVSLSKYATTLNGAIRDDGRVYAGFRQYGAATGRMTSGGADEGIKLNLQNIPRDKRFRNVFEAPEGCVYLDADYPQIEVRVIAEVAQDKAMMKAFRDGVDIYRSTAAGMSKCKLDDVDAEARQRAKPLVLGMQFGLGSAKLGKYAFLNYGVSLADPEASRNGFFELYPQLKAWQKKIGNDLEKPGIYESRTKLGRRRTFVGDVKEHGYGAALNHPVQGGAGDIIKTALVKLPELVLEYGLESFELVSVVHDEILAIVKEEEKEAGMEVLRRAMEEAAAEFLEIPLKVAVGWGPSWGTAKV